MNTQNKLPNTGKLASLARRLVRPSGRITIEIAKKDLWWLRQTLDQAVVHMESCPNPAAWSRCPEVGRKTIRKLNRAAKKAFGHDLAADCLSSSSPNTKVCPVGDAQPKAI